ncbi:hypothetical protein QA601_02265 [Chitinispirillales bacterium ANBcel5]|uniref:hypothetical protein n=1 Tax=Cellulosispirillum alkaliphilum TaxID=3039283 RepID=UPI002A57752F|nr:hypothetical protein [Chitinispirillales bacterium ANBcel5]
MKLYVALLITSITLLFSCHSGGSGSEIVNGNISMGMEGAMVEAYRIETDTSDFSVTTALTDRNGEFFLHLEAGQYNLFIRDTALNIGTFIPGVKRGDKLQDIDLFEMGAIEVIVESRFYLTYQLFIPSSPFNTIAESNQLTRIEHVPPGNYRIEYDTLFVGEALSDLPDEFIPPDVKFRELTVEPSDVVPVRFRYQKDEV